MEIANLWDAHPAVVAALYAQLREICRDPGSGLPFDVGLSA
ncbi:hypothetical protein ACQP1P_32775 [Dactylosporangium sp. CA-052675]